MPDDKLTKITRSEERLKLYSDMVDKAIRELNSELTRADHPILKLPTIARDGGYVMAVKERGADTTKLGTLVESEAKKIEPSIRPLFK